MQMTIIVIFIKKENTVILFRNGSKEPQTEVLAVFFLSLHTENTDKGAMWKGGHNLIMVIHVRWIRCRLQVIYKV